MLKKRELILQQIEIKMVDNLSNKKVSDFIYKGFDEQMCKPKDLQSQKAAAKDDNLIHKLIS